MGEGVNFCAIIEGWDLLHIHNSIGFKVDKDNFAATLEVVPG